MTYNLNQAEFLMVHCAIDRLLDLHEKGEIVITLSQLRILRNIRRKPIYLTIAQKNRIMAIINGIYIRHRNLYSIMTPGQKKKKDRDPTVREIGLRLSATYSSLLALIPGHPDNSKQ